MFTQVDREQVTSRRNKSNSWSARESNGSHTGEGNSNVLFWKQSFFSSEFVSFMHSWVYAKLLMYFKILFHVRFNIQRHIMITQAYEKCLEVTLTKLFLCILGHRNRIQPIEICDASYSPYARLDTHNNGILLDTIMIHSWRRKFRSIH